jgi:2-iminoacetate synthase
MAFLNVFNGLPWTGLLSAAGGADSAAVKNVLESGVRTLSDFATLLSPAAEPHLETMARKARALTQRRFGKVIRLYAPVYLSNECVNNCTYCGFSRDNAIRRVTLNPAEVRTEAEALAVQGFRHLLLVAGEHPKWVSGDYLRDCISALRPFIPSISLEVAPMETEGYAPLVAAGAEGLVVYHETYDRDAYAQVHTAGPKRDFDWRLATAERAYDAGFRRLGIGALHGLADWRMEAVATAAHAEYLLRRCWKASLTVSVPRLRPCAGGFQPQTHVSDRELARLITAFRLFLPDAGLVLSTRESARLRDGLFLLGVTHASAGSHTEPGGYTGAGRDKVRLAMRGRDLAVEADTVGPGDGSTSATGQFEIADSRSPADVAEAIRNLGYEPVWKDWDSSLSA